MYPLGNSSNNVKGVDASIWWSNLDFRVTIEHNYGFNFFFGETIH